MRGLLAEFGIIVALKQPEILEAGITYPATSIHAYVTLLHDLMEVGLQLIGP